MLSFALHSISGLFSKTIPVLDEVNTSIPVLLSTGVREYGELDFGEYKWFGFTAETSGLFRFRMDSRSLALVGDLFNSITSGRSNEGRLAISKEDLGADAFSVDCFLQADETVYLRVRSQDWSGEGIFSVIVERVADNASDISIKSSDVVFEGSEYPEDCMSQDFFLRLFRRYIGYPAETLLHHRPSGLPVPKKLLRRCIVSI